MQRDKMKVESEALFTSRMNPFSHEESDILMEECNLDLEVIESFVLVGFNYLKICYFINCFDDVYFKY